MRLARTLSALFLLLASLTVTAQGPGEKRAMAWIEAFNSGNADQMEAFVQANYTPEALQRRTPEERRKFFQNLRSAHGNLEVVGIDFRNRDLDLEVRPQRGEVISFSFSFEPAAPFRIAGLGIRIGGPAERGSRLPRLDLPPNATQEQIAAKLDAYLRDLESRDLFSGSVLVAKDGQVLFEKACGLASRRFSAPNRITTRFNVGSITKDFTRVAIGQLAQAGKLKLDAPIAAYLPDYPDKEAAQKITVQQIVDHTSGLGDVFTPRFWEKNSNRFERPADFVEFFGKDPLQFQPGQGRFYSNYGYTVLGAIIEEVSGENYYDYIQKHVFDAAGMKGSGFFDFRRPVPDLAIGHTHQLPNGRSEEWLESTSIRPSPRGIPAGGSYSSARDLLAFDRAARSGKLLNAEWTRWYYRGGETRNGVIDAGISSAGGMPGVNAGLTSDGTWTVVVLANIDPPVAEDLADTVIFPAVSGAK